MLTIHGLALTIALVLNAAANLLMKSGMTKIHDEGGLLRDGPVQAIINVITNPTLIIGLTCFGLNAGFYMFALQSRTLKISVAYPLMVSGGYAIIATLGYLWLGERLSSAQMVGVAMIMAGVIVVASQSAVAAPTLSSP